MTAAFAAAAVALTALALAPLVPPLLRSLPSDASGQASTAPVGASAARVTSSRVSATP